MVRAGGLVAGAALAGLVLAGCGGSGSDRGTTPSASTVTSASSSASIADPSASPSYSVPPEAQVQTEAGAVAFVTFYFEQVNKAWMTPDSTLLPPLTESGCKSCDSLQEHAVDLAAKDQHTTTAAVRVASATPRVGAPAGQQFVTIQLDQLGATTIDSSGAVVDADPVQSLKREVVLVWEGGRWLLYGISA